MTNDISNYNDLGLALSYDRTVADLCGGDITKYLTIIKKLLKLISFSRNDQVIELGAGTGLASELILEHNFSRLYLLDRSRMVLEVAEQRLTRYDPQWEFLANKHFQNQ